VKKIITVIGARPQFIKHFPLEQAAKGKIELLTIHTGQHYDTDMSQVFFDELGMKRPDYMLDIGSGSHGLQTGKMMMEIEKIVLQERPEGIIVYGDTNSTLAGALVASKLHIPLVHIEAGLRSYNKEMPEEVNRVLTDHISNFLFVPSKQAELNLKKEGIHENIFNVGDIMKDLVESAINNKWVKDMGVQDPYIYTTIHRPYNTDDKSRLEYVLTCLNSLGKKIIFPIHPRTQKLMADYGLKSERFSNISFLKPQGYLNNLSYLVRSDALITDSGGMQKEAYWLKKKCVTIRKETEWIETLDHGWNALLFEDLSGIKDLIRFVPKEHVQLYGEGQIAGKIIDTIEAGV
jgi:UDP-GlcNAc3NAcA epimerase